MKGFYLLLLKWFALIVPSLVMAVVGRLLAPLLPFFADENARLPNWLDWFNTPHTNLDGDERHRERWKGDDAFHTWLRRTAWLLRNVAYGFDRNVLGITLPEIYEFVQIGDPNVGDLSGVSGTVTRYACKNGKILAWQYYYVHHYKIFGLWKCVRIGFGWKIWNNPEPSRCCQFWLYAHPFKASGRGDII